MPKKQKEQKEIGAANMLRFYDSDLVERLNKRFNESGSRYEHRNHFLTDLIKAGLNRREYENSLRDELLKNDAAMYQSIDAFAERFIEFEKYVRTQFQTISAANYVMRALLSNVYSISESLNSGFKLSSELIRNGKYDKAPERFEKMKINADGVYVKDE